MRKQHCSEFFSFSCDVVPLPSYYLEIARVREREQQSDVRSVEIRATNRLFNRVWNRFQNFGGDESFDRYLVTFGVGLCIAHMTPSLSSLPPEWGPSPVGTEHTTLGPATGSRSCPMFERTALPSFISCVKTLPCAIRTAFERLKWKNSQSATQRRQNVEDISIRSEN